MFNFIDNIVHIGDMLAVPFFALLIFYFYKKKNKTIFEYILYLFSIAGFLFDLTFSYSFLF